MEATEQVLPGLDRRDRHEHGRLGVLPEHGEHGFLAVSALMAVGANLSRVRRDVANLEQVDAHQLFRRRFDLPQALIGFGRVAAAVLALEHFLLPVVATDAEQAADQLMTVLMAADALKFAVLVVVDGLVGVTGADGATVAGHADVVAALLALPSFCAGVGRELGREFVAAEILAGDAGEGLVAQSGMPHSANSLNGSG